MSGDKHSLFLDNVPDIAPREDSGSRRPVASWWHCEGGQYLISNGVCDYP